MDAARFDGLTRRFGLAGSRRRALGALLAAALTPLAPLPTAAQPEPTRCLAVGKRCRLPETEAERRKRKKHGKGKHHHPPSCNKCCSRFGAAGPDGKARCTCKGEGIACDNPSQCCSGDCRDGNCTACPPNTVFCPDGCANLQTDNNHCGSCDKACANGQRCQDGKCICDAQSCPTGCCGGEDGTACQRGTSDGACGDDGLVCAICQAPDVCVQQACCTPACSGKCDGEADGCGGTCGCPTGQFCASGTCVVGQGTCASGADFCANISESTYCDGRHDCFCTITTEGDTRCGGNAVTGNCGDCASTADCEASHPEIAGVFCLKGGTGCCNPTAPNGSCIRPCPS